MPNDFDRIFKENLGHTFFHLASKYFGFEVRDWKVLSPKLTGTFEREVDYLYEVETCAGEEFLLHIEFQTRDDPHMLARMGVCHALLFDRYGKPIRHHVVYLGKSPSKMATRLDPVEIFKGFDLLSLRDQHLETMVTSDHPWEVVLGILANFGEISDEEGLTAIFKRLKGLNLAPTEWKRSVAQLKILSRLRKLDHKIVATLKNMPIDFNIDVQEDAFFLWGKEEGFEAGFKAERVSSAARFVREGLPIEQVARVQGVSVEEIQQYLAQQ